MYQQSYWHDREFETIAKLQEIARLSGEPLAKLAIAWVLALVIIHHLLSTGQPYEERTTASHTGEHWERQIQYLLRRLSALGVTDQKPAGQSDRGRLSEQLS